VGAMPTVSTMHADAGQKKKKEKGKRKEITNCPNCEQKLAEKFKPEL
jgi:hypothetical protein